ncbi:translocator protein-like isoform X1 [Aricia agestis]|nr:translocator protein-like isoform X1 [Aricia agestis]XP_041985430.1 translocator protein-like isoform X1 [Aricia agestis]XP_041985431.1 translocator protein-like isoform X1 [Aricia agestis]XP_041985433.1 translocator protein-like isoform X1 [Aricia agestis]
MVNWSMLGSIVLPNVGGWANGLYFAGQIRKGDEKSWYDNLNKPSWNPPKWVFGPAWTVLYCSMGYASYLVLEDCGGFTEQAILPMTLYGTQLALNWSWTPIFFGMKDFKLAFIEISVLSGAAVATTISFFSVNQTAGALMLPYLAWLGYASSLSYYIWKNNPKDEKKN